MTAHVTSPFTEGTLAFRPIDHVDTASGRVVRGRIQIPVRTCSNVAYVKLLSERGFAVESICAWLVRELRLPGPEAFWVRVNQSALPKIWPFENSESRICFATAALLNARPFHAALLHETIGLETMGLNDILLITIAAFDALIGNDDRHNGNLLWSPPRGVFLIDHERALGGVAMDLFPSILPTGVNYLLQRIQSLPVSRRSAMKTPLREFCARCVTAVSALPFDQIVTSDLFRISISNYLTMRAETLYADMSSAIGVPDLSGLGVFEHHPIQQ